MQHQKQMLSGLNEISKVPQFELISHDDVPFSSPSLEGKVWLANFIFTRCQMICPQLSREMKQIQNKLGTYSNLRLVSFSVDPNYDSPEVLKDYALKQGADLKTWSFLTGEKSKIDRVLIDGFKIGSYDDPMLHSDRFVLVDARGSIRAYYSLEDKDSLKKMQRDIAFLLKRPEL